MYAKQNPMICSTTGTSGTCGTSFEEHVVLVEHVIHPNPVRNNIFTKNTTL